MTEYSSLTTTWGNLRQHWFRDWGGRLTAWLGLYVLLFFAWRFFRWERPRV